MDESLLTVTGWVPPTFEAGLRMTVGLASAAILGGLIGWDRERKGRAAGLRTHIMVAVGAALFTLVATENGSDPTVLSELVKGIAAGIGFLGSGAILKHEGRVEGLTTAATIWLTAAVGLAVGAGAMWLAALTTVVSLFVLIVLSPFSNNLSNDESAAS